MRLKAAGQSFGSSGARVPVGSRLLAGIRGFGSGVLVLYCGGLILAYVCLGLCRAKES